MPLGNWNVEWQDLNGQRNYPLADDATGLDVTGSFRLPTDFLVELDLPVNAGMDVDPTRFFVLHVGAYAAGYSVVVGYQPASGDPVAVASALVPRQAHAKNTAYALGGIGDYADTVGKVVVGSLDNADLQPAGLWTFALAAARLDPDAVRPIVGGVTALVAVNGGGASAPVRGDVELVAGANIQLAVVQVDGQDPIIRISAVRGEGTIEPCICDGADSAAVPIVSINGVRATDDGGFTLSGTDCLQIEATTNGLRLVDTCAAPCCGCAELERITTDLQRLADRAGEVQDFVNALQTNVETMSLTVLGSKLGDAGCISCA